MNISIYVTTFIMISLSLCGAAHDDDQPKVNVLWGACSSRGDEDIMKQRYVIKSPFNGNSKEFFFGLYDGHGGHGAADMAADGKKNSQGHVPPLHELIAQCKDIYPHRYTASYAAMDKAIRAEANHSSGTSAVTIRIKNGQLSYGYVGNSRLLLIEKGGKLISTVDHTLANEDEIERVARHEGGTYFITSAIGKIRDNRVVTRSLGDKRMKEHVKGLIAKPNINEQHLLRGNRLRYESLVVASSSLWEFMTDLDVDYILAKALDENNEVKEVHDPTRIEDGNSRRTKLAAQALVNVARHEGCKDNITAMVVTFKLATIHAIDIEFPSEPEAQPIENAVEAIKVDETFVLKLAYKLEVVQQNKR